MSQWCVIYVLDILDLFSFFDLFIHYQDQLYKCRVEHVTVVQEIDNVLMCAHTDKPRSKDYFLLASYWKSNTFWKRT